MTPTVIESNRRLANLLGWTNIVTTGGALLGSPPPGQLECRGQALVPDWAGDWRECGPLMVRHDCYPAIDTSEPDILFAYFGKANEHGQHDYEFVFVSRYANADAAARAVVVAAVSRELESVQ